MFDLSVTNFLMVLTIACSVYAISNRHFFYKARFLPLVMDKSSQWYRFISYALIHADYLHLAVNMFVLYSFGNFTEDVFGLAFEQKGKIYFFLMYALAAVTSVIPAYERHKRNAGYSAVGASGAVSAVVFSSILFNPNSGMGILFLPFFLPAWLFGLIYLIYSWYMAQKGDSLIGHDAHFFGALFGIGFTLLLRPELAFTFLQRINLFN
jgi:membrane associated rhomboid family serine protease